MYHNSYRLFLPFCDNIKYFKYFKLWNLNNKCYFGFNSKYSRNHSPCIILNDLYNNKKHSYIHSDSVIDHIKNSKSNNNTNDNFNNEHLTSLDHGLSTSDHLSSKSEVERVLDMIRSTNLNEMNDYIFETIDNNILNYNDSFTFNDINTLLQMSLRNFYSQNVIKALVLKMQSSDPSELSINTLAILIQNIGRLQPCELDFDKIKEFFDKSCEYILTLDSLSESNFSSIIYGFQRLHYFNYKFLNSIVKRYYRDLSGVNINSLIISFSSIIKLNYFNIRMILGIYSQISKSIYNMTLQTTIQLINTISKIHEYYNCNDINKDENSTNSDENVTNKKLSKLNKTNNTLMNYMVKNVCNNYVSVVNLVQTSLILNSMNKMGFKKPAYISKLINTLVVNNNVTNNEFDNYNNNEEKHTHDLDTMDNDIVEPKPSDQILVIKSRTETSLNESILRDSKNKEKNILSYKEFPECPFNRQKTLIKLQSTDPNHLILICDSLFGLDYYTDYSLNLMFVIKEIISPMLHELKANNIIMFLQAFTNINFTDYQINGLKFKKRLNKEFNSNEIELLLNSLSENDNHNTHWFNSENLVSKVASEGHDDSKNTKLEFSEISEPTNYLKDTLKNRLSRSEWKEELVLNCFENMLRHVHYIKSSPSMLRKFRFQFELLAKDIYITNYHVYFKIGQMLQDQSNEIDDDEMNNHWITRFKTIPAILPENIIGNLVELYLTRDSDQEVSDDSHLNFESQELKPESNQNISQQFEPQLSKVENQNEVKLYKVGCRKVHVDKDVFGIKIPILITVDPEQ